MRSNPALSALRRASAVDTTPTCSPFSSTRRTWAEVIISFTRGPSRDGVLSKGGRAIVWLLVAVENLPSQAFSCSGPSSGPPPLAATSPQRPTGPFRGPLHSRSLRLRVPRRCCVQIGGLGLDPSHCFAERKNLLLGAAQAAQRDLALLRLPPANHGDHRHLGEQIGRAHV